MRLQSLRPSWTGVTGVLVILLGLVFIGLGGWLILLGGVWYYAIAGIGLAATGALVVVRWRRALFLHATPPGDCARPRDGPGALALRPRGGYRCQ
ncbi:hypothetical protein TMO_1465 [Tistrella mobilis KA081020-065]|uniref:Uncharacterized protein n=1 Tax=Tistrella mobilis (strain KA081020-065) TaxID=1110502 RepID=I3TKL6_TISMK|nr:hypothetical protein TMO_1465 [Tistrella mobilis KA081020-065]